MEDGREISESDIDRLTDELLKEFVPLETVEPADNLDDLAPLGATLEDADVIGLGEASHGTREFFQFKHRLFRYLVEKQGLRLLGLESNFAAMLDINSYVVDGSGAAEDVLSQESIHGSYQTETVLQLIEWIRSFNESRDRNDKVRFHGFDVQNASPAASKLRRYLKQTGSGSLDDIESEVELLVDQGMPNMGDDEVMRSHLDARETVVSRVEDSLNSDESLYVDATSRKEYERARRLVWMIEQGRKQFQAIHDGRAESGTNVRIRDSAMAAQVQWLRRHEGLDRIVLWGHNAHLTRDAFSGGTVRNKQAIPSLGKNLATLSGIKYYSLGLVLGGGSVTAAYVPEDEYRPYEIEEPPRGSIPDVFSRVTSPIFFLDIARMSSETELDSWFDSQPQHFDIVGGYEVSPVNLVGSNYGSQFDGLVYINTTSPSRPISAEFSK